nr:polymorphic toxin type 44 domain-containing protein [Ignavibacteria bacterium]
RRVSSRQHLSVAEGGMGVGVESTHTDEDGNVIAVYDDGDDGVYLHSNGTTKAQIDQQRTDNKNTGGTGTNIGEIGGTLNADGIYTNTLNKNIEEAKSIYNPFTFRNYVKTNGKWDLKNNKKTIYGLANDGKTQFSFNGELMESQDIGNHHFGAVALAYGLFPSEKFILEQAGEYQIKSGTSRPEWQIYKEETRYNYSKLGTPISYKVKVMQPPYGDDPRDQKWIKSGFQYFKNK